MLEFYVMITTELSHSYAILTKDNIYSTTSILFMRNIAEVNIENTSIVTSEY